ncbi:TonB-dependent receptor [Sphingomonas sp. Root710]|uniref:TonB-dependent receptor n=1 Tax=Sphingomonas sp. Root710 TaxID=1736594 RepID=UPI0009EAB2A7|nr:TonB-dependent receptor [Sphingomonas sp. Root710]
MSSSLKSLMMLSCAASALFLTSAANAQATPDTSAAAPDNGYGDIIVTAQKRSERLRDVPMSITAATGDELRSRGIASTDDLGKLVTGFTAARTGTGMPVYFIRGVGFFDTTLGVSPAVTVYMDQVPLPYSPMSRGATLDLARVEVLKGPQGTLFGQNSTGGAINYIAAKPTDQFDAGFELTAGRFRQVDAEGYISGPIGEGLTARVAVRNEYRDEWQYNYVNGEKNGKRRFLNGRALLDWQISDGAKLSLSASGWKDRSEAQQEQFVAFTPLVPVSAGGRPAAFPFPTFPPAPNNNRAAAFDPGGDLRQDTHFYQFSARGDFDLTDAVTLTSLTSYAKFKSFIPIDQDGTIYPMASTLISGNIRSFSQELRLAGTSGPVQWMIGGNYQNDTVKELFDSDVITSGAGFPGGTFLWNGFKMNNDQKVRTYSGFGSLDYALSDTLKLQGSVRYSKQDRDFSGCARDDGTGQIAAAFSFLASFASGIPQVIPPGGCATLNDAFIVAPNNTGTLNEDNLSWRGSINYKPNDTTLLYASITKGYKSGSFPTLPASNTAQIRPVKQESIQAYEAGVKTSLLDRAVDLDGAVFYYDYSDKQLQGYVALPIFGNLPSLVSIPKSRVWGTEANALIRPVKGLSINAGITYINSKVQSDPSNPKGPYATPTQNDSFIGQSFPFSPKWQSVVDAQYQFPISETVDFFVGASVSSRSSTKGTLLSGRPAVAPLEAKLSIPGYSLVDGRIGVTSNDGIWRVELWGRNIFDKFYVTNANRGNDTTYRFTGMPATYGVTFKYRFGG